MKLKRRKKSYLFIFERLSNFRMATAVVHETRDSETFAPVPFDDTRFIFLDGYSDTSSYKSYAATVATHNVGSEIMDDIEDVIEEAPQPRDELNFELPMEESSSLDEQQTLDCKISDEVLFPFFFLFLGQTHIEQKYKKIYCYSLNSIKHTVFLIKIF